jgi:YD repeat-containing protein
MDGSLGERQVTTYHEAGTALERVTMDPDGARLGRTVFRYDAAGRLVEEAGHDAAGAETRRVTYERNADGHVVAWEVYMNGELDRRTEVDYDAQGRAVEERTYQHGRMSELETYSEPGRVSEVVAYDREGRVRSTRTVVRSANGMERMEIFDRDGHLQFVSTWSYGANGLLTERSTVDGSGVGEVYTYAYELDGTGNWIRMVVTEAFGDAEPTTYEIRDRAIAYH